MDGVIISEKKSSRNWDKNKRTDNAPPAHRAYSLHAVEPFPAYVPACRLSIAERLARAYDPCVHGYLTGVGFEPTYTGYEPVR